MNENSDIDNSTDERTVDFEWTIHSKHNQLHCRFQITYNYFFTLETPLAAIWTRSSKFVNMLTAKIIWVSTVTMCSRKLLEAKPLTKFESHRRKIFTVRHSKNNYKCIFPR